jgi:hypothetical protein
MQQYQPITANLATVTTAAGSLTSLIDNGVPTGYGSGGTHFENALPKMNTVITGRQRIGRGNAATLCFFGDGRRAGQPNPDRRWLLVGQQPRHDPRYDHCSLLKNRGITLSIL